jgi:hypothetical protein
MYRDTTTVKHEMYNFTSSNWSEWNLTNCLKIFESHTGKHSTYPQQQTATLGASHIIYKVLKPETCSLNSGDDRQFKRSTSDRK